MRLKLYVWQSSRDAWLWEIDWPGRPRVWRTNSQPIEWGVAPTFEQAITVGRASLARVTS